MVWNTQTTTNGQRCALLALSLLLARPVAADEPARKIAESIEMQQGTTRLKLEEKPLLFYTNPVRQNDQHGTIFLWTDRGRPAVFGSIWSEVNRMNSEVRNVTHELHSLAESLDVRAIRNGDSAVDRDHGFLGTPRDP